MMTHLIAGPALEVEAVQLTPNAPWSEIAVWCYGRIENWRDDRGDWHSYIAVPQTTGGPLKAWEWDWVVRYPDGSVRVFSSSVMPQAALYPALWSKLMAAMHHDCPACGDDPNVGCRDRHEAEADTKLAVRVVAEHLGLAPEIPPG